MHYFQYRGASLFAEGVRVERIAEEAGTPVFIYSQRTLKRHYEAFGSAFKKAAHIICYSVKANSNLSVLKTFADLGSGFDIVSGGELFRALKAGADPARVVFSGVGKTEEEIAYALKKGILMFNVESPQELKTLDAVAGRLRKRARFAIRVNPDVDPRTHPYISTGLKKNKFGVESSEAIGLYVHARDNLKNVEAVGIDCHIGSQLTRIGPFVEALKKTKRLVKTLRREGVEIRYLDMGGGLGITYDKEAPPHPSKYGNAVIRETRGLDVTLIFEPGRVIVGNAGILVTKVIYTKKTPYKNFIIVDAAMNDLARPSLYGSYHAIKAVRDGTGTEITADVVGPVCESGDFLAKDRLLPDVKPGEFLAVMSAGAYGFTMSSNYNSRPRAAEVMVRGRSFSVVKKRERLEDLVRGEAVS
ncbi:MAG TPA: diaminopimelate decarboxylase [Thermodesulfobacteriota bacterium]|nr:diaminopimelate decarboxylase [Thermodesulfobacteriota bacterium]